MKVSPSKLKVLLKNRGLTIKQFGKKLGMTRQGSYDLMKRVSVKEDMVDAICKVLQVDRDEFLESDKPPLSDRDEQIFSLQKTVIELQREIIGLQRQLFIKPKKEAAQAVSSQNRKS